MIKIALVDDEVLFLKGMSLLIDDMSGIEVIMMASNGEELLKNLDKSTIHPEIVLLDLNMPKKNGIDTSMILKDKYPLIKIIIISSHFNKTFVLYMLQLGASAYLAKDTSPEYVETAIRGVNSNGFCYTPQVQEIIQRSFSEREKSKKVQLKVHLSKRELEILELICNQWTNAEMAKKLYLSIRTIEGHRKNLLLKLNCKNTAGMVAFAVQNHLVNITPRLL